MLVFGEATRSRVAPVFVIVWLLCGALPGRFVVLPATFREKTGQCDLFFGIIEHDVRRAPVARVRVAFYRRDEKFNAFTRQPLHSLQRRLSVVVRVFLPGELSYQAGQLSVRLRRGRGLCPRPGY